MSTLIESILPTMPTQIPADHIAIPVHKSTKAALLIVWGDADGSGQPDVSVKTFGVVPFMRASLHKIVDLGPFNIPLDTIQSAVLAGVGAAPIPQPAKLVIQGVVATVTGALRIML